MSQRKLNPDQRKRERKVDDNCTSFNNSDEDSSPTDDEPLNTDDELENFMVKFPADGEPLNTDDEVENFIVESNRNFRVVMDNDILPDSVDQIEPMMGPWGDYRPDSPVMNTYQAHIEMDLDIGLVTHALSLEADQATVEPQMPQQHVLLRTEDQRQYVWRNGRFEVLGVEDMTEK